MVDQEVKQSRGEVTRLLAAWSGGDQEARERLIPLVYGELRQLADRYLRRERPDHTLQPTALVHEAYLRLVNPPEVRWQDRAHFFGIAARVMRQILVNHAISRRTAKRGGAATKVPLDDAAGLSQEGTVDLLALDEALSRLATLDPQQCRIVELRFFGGLTIDETADVVGISAATVKREWNTAKAWLHGEMSDRHDS